MQTETRIRTGDDAPVTCKRLLRWVRRRICPPRRPLGSPLAHAGCERPGVDWAVG